MSNNRKKYDEEFKKRTASRVLQRFCVSRVAHHAAGRAEIQPLQAPATIFD